MTQQVDNHETDVLIVGGGVTGTGVMRDLALRGINCLLIDRQDLNAGASGGNHGLLHSGGRYAVTDTETAAECRREAQILKSVAAHCIDDCGGMFVAVAGDDEDYVDAFPEHCRAAGIDLQSLTLTDARELEPNLSDTVFAAFTVPDATIDPFRITLESVSHAQQLNDSRYLAHTEVTGFEISNGEIKAALCVNTKTAQPCRVIAKQYVNAGGAWAMQVAQLAGCNDVSLLLSKGTLIISNTRVTDRVVNRLRPAGNGDILVPGGTVSLLGTSSATVDNLEDIRPTVDEVECNLKEGIAMLPALASTRFIRAFAGVRPLLQASGNNDDGRGLSRGFTLFDHHSEGMKNLATIAGGKLTTFRLMAEKSADLVAQRLGNTQSCTTATVPLPQAEPVRWTEPGYAARDWFRRNDPEDLILCECEMIAQSAVDSIIQHVPGMHDSADISAISLRSRVGKGSCQGSFCSIRLSSYLYDQNMYDSAHGLNQVREFVAERFKGTRPVLWGEQMPQMELAEALHCGLMGLDMLESDAPE